MIGPRTTRAIGASSRALFRACPGLAGLLVTDVLLTLAELAAAVVVPWWIVTQGGASAMASYAIALAVTTMFVVVAASPLGDRYCKAVQIRCGLLGIAVALAGIAWCATRAFVLLPVLSLAAANMLARAFVEPSQAALLPELVPAGRLPQAIRLQKTCRAVSGVAGPMLAGALLVVASASVAIAGCALLVVVAFLAAWMIPRRPGEARRLDARQWWRDLRFGAKAKWGVPMERGWTIVNFVVWIFQGPAVGMLVPIKVHSLGLAGNWLGVALASLSVGVVTGSLFGSGMLVRRFGRYRVRLGFGCMEGACLAVVGMASSPVLMAAALVAAGFCNAAMALVGATHRALAIPKSHRVRMLASGTVSTQIAGTIGAALVGVSLERWAVPMVYTGFGVLMAIFVLGFVLVPRFREFLELDHDRIQDWYVREYPQVFV